MSFRTLPFLGLFPALLAAQRPSNVDRQRVAAGLWAEARYNYAYWDAVRANWDSAFAATVTMIDTRVGPGGPGGAGGAGGTGGGTLTDLQFFRQLRRWGALLHDGQFEPLPPAARAARTPRP